MYVASKRALKYVRQEMIGLKRETDKSIIRVGSCNTLFVISGTSKQKISKDMGD